jgi:hypothetical protein
VTRLASFLRTPFSFLFPGSAKEERVAEYVIREHSGGRPLDEILQDHYVQNRLTPQQQARLLDRPEVVQAIGADSVAAARSYLAEPS